MAKLTPKQVRALKAQAHHKNVIVQTGGKGLTQAVIDEARGALEQHELLKVKLVAGVEERKYMAAELCKALDAELVQLIGQVAVIYRLNTDRAAYGAILKTAK